MTNVFLYRDLLDRGAKGRWQQAAKVGVAVVLITALTGSSVVVGHQEVEDRATLERCVATIGKDAAEACAKAYKWVKDSGVAIPRSEALYAKLIEGALSIGDFEGAAIMSRAAIREFPKTPQFYYRLGVILLDNRDAPFEAYGPLLEAVRLDPSNATVRHRFGDAALQMGHYSEALKNYERAASLEQASWELQYGRAKALRAMSRKREALRILETLRSAERAHSLGVLSWLMRAELLADVGRRKDAIREYNALLDTRIPPGDQMLAWCGQARTFRLLGQQLEFERACKQARAVTPGPLGVDCPCR